MRLPYHLMVALCGLFALFLGGIATSAAAPMTDVHYEYVGRGHVAGALHGSCQAYGAILDPSHEIRFEAKESQAHFVTIWANKTTVLPGQPGEVQVSTPYDYELKSVIHELPSGTYEIHGREGSHAALLPASSDVPGLSVTFDSVDASWSGVLDAPRSKPYLQEASGEGVGTTLMNGLVQKSGAFPTGSRGVVFEGGVLEANGTAILHLRGVDLVTPIKTVQLPDFPEETGNTTGPGNTARVVTLRMDEIFLHVEGLRMHQSNSETNWMCAGMVAQVDGSMTVARATGQARVGDEEHAFERQVLTLEGSYRIVEHPHERGGSRITANANGAVRVMGVDFNVVAIGGGIEDLLMRVGVAGALVAGILYGVKKVAPTATSMLLRQRSISPDAHPVRKAILQQLDEQSVVPVKELPAVLGQSRTSVRYHVDVLVAAGSAKMFMFNGQVMICSMNTARHWKDHAVEAHDTLKAVKKFAHRRLSRPEVVRLISEEHGVTLRSARKMVKRYEDLTGQTPFRRTKT